MTSDDDRVSSADPTEDTRSSRSQSKSSSSKRKPLPLWQETILLLGVALVLALVVKTFFIQAFYIPSESMEPGLIVDDRILVQKVSYWGGGEPERGDVVVFEDPGGWLKGVGAEPASPMVKVMTKLGLYPTGGHLVKRVIGVAGDTIECCDNKGRLLVNGQPLDEDDYVQRLGATCSGPMVNGCDRDWKAGPIPDGHVFVMGDNRSRSADSSEHMCTDLETECVPGEEFVKVDSVVGKVFVLLWPADRFTWKTRPETFEDVPDAKS